ncbi:MAG: hypothetical protein KME26_14825 [Oscillatoria princeps RMCB-10]|nr:hypothetical protein [Oscillatoria princeps RMCB-10]
MGGKACWIGHFLCPHSHATSAKKVGLAHREPQFLQSAFATAGTDEFAALSAAVAQG